jgi:hypothetical protein
MLDPARNEGDRRAAPCQSNETGTRIRAKNVEPRPRRLAKLGLPENGVRAARENHAFAGKRIEDRQAGKPPHERAVLLLIFARG